MTHAGASRGEDVRISGDASVRFEAEGLHTKGVATSVARLEERKAQALRQLRGLTAHPDATVQRAAREIVVDIEALPASIDAQLQAMIPKGAELTSVGFNLIALPSLRESGGVGGLYVFRRPVRLRVVRDGEYFLAFSSAFLVHGVGDNVSDAMRDFFREWEKHYQSLVDFEQRDRLGEPLRLELERIRHSLQQPTPVPVSEADWVPS